MPPTPPIAKMGAMWIWFIAWFIVFFYLSRRKVRDLRKVVGISLPLAFLLVIPFFDFSLPAYVEETRSALLPLFSENALALVLGVAIMVSEFALFWKLSMRKLPAEEYRHVVHSLASLLIAYFAFVSIDLAFLFLSVYICIFSLGEYFRHTPMPGRYAGELKRWIIQWLGAGERVSAESKLFMPAYFGFAGMGIPMVFLSRDFALACILVFALGDPAATMVGRRFGRTKWPHNPKKSLEGSGAMLSAVLAVLLSLRIEPLVAGAVAVSVTLFESLPLRMSDNLIIPLMAGMVLVGCT